MCTLILASERLTNYRLVGTDVVEVRIINNFFLSIMTFTKKENIVYEDLEIDRACLYYMAVILQSGPNRTLSHNLMICRIRLASESVVSQGSLTGVKNLL